ncbi:MAG TPA: DUF2497 domain-containing protein [Xanthobacteraceae bacterium]|nr:DUF2497 domain-containing protein [Xanthobacteraceae bacterium]
MSMTARAVDPSMEEILASIRRIIADDTPARPAGRAQAGDSEAHAGETVEMDEAWVPPAPQERPGPMVRSVPVKEASATRADLSGLVEPVAPAPVLAAPAPVVPAAPPVAEPPSVAAAAPEPFVAARPVVPPAAAAPLPPRLPSSFAMPPRPLAAERPADRQTDRLVSAPTNAAVAAAFGTLSRTVAPQQSRSLEDVVGDLLRPMLRSWLDENLPAVVERLVRAEIERVTRDGR